MNLRMKLLSSTALAAAAVLGAASVSAQDIGALEKRVQALEKSGGGQNVSRSKKAMSLVVSGHVNQQINFVDNGNSSALIMQGNGPSNSRVRFVGSGGLTDDLSLKTLIELGSTSSSNSNVDSNAEGTDQGAFTVKNMSVGIASKTLGTVTLGDHSLADDGYHSIGDLSGMGIINNNAASATVGANFFHLNTGASSGIAISSTTNNLDAGAKDNISYDSPRFAGFQLQASIANEDGTNIGINYGGDFGGVKVKGGANIDTIRTGTDATANTVTNGSLGVMLPMGLNGWFGISHKDAETGGRDEDKWNVNLGYNFKATELGETRVGIRYMEHDDKAAKGDTLTEWSLSLLQVLEPIGAESYISYQNYSLDRTGLNVDDINVVAAGMRISF